MATDEITLPEGFQLDAPTLPEGFTLDTPKPENPFHAVDLLGPAGTAYRMAPSVISGFERGSAGLLKTLGSIGNYIADAATGPEPGTPNQVAEKFRNQWQNVLIDKISKNADYWDAKSQANHTDAITEAVGQAVGSLPPAMVDWLGNVPFAAAKGMAEAEQRGEGIGGQLKQGGIEAVKRATLGLIFHGLGEINNPVIRRGGGALVMGGTAVAEGERNPANVLASLMMGGILTGKSKGQPPEGFEADRPIEAPQGEPPAREELVQRNVNPTPEEQADKVQGNQEIADLLKEKLTPEELAKVDLTKAPLSNEEIPNRVGNTVADIQNRDIIRENVDKLQPKDIELLKPYAGEEWADRKIAELQGKKSAEVGKVYRASRTPFDSTKITKDGIFVSPDKSFVEGWSSAQGDRRIEELTISPTAKIMPRDEIPEKFRIDDGNGRWHTTVDNDVMNGIRDYALSKGYDGYENYSVNPDGSKYGREVAVFNPEVLKSTTSPTEAKTSKPTGEPDRNELIKQGHAIPRSLGWNNEQRKAFNKKITGKESMSEMNMTEMQSLADALQVEAVSAGKPYGAKKPKAVVAPNLPEVPQTMTVGGQKLPAKIVLDGAVKDAAGLHPPKAEPKILSAENGIVREGLWKTAVSTMVGDNNLSIPALAKKIGGVFGNIVHSVFIEDYAEGQRGYNGFLADLLKTIPQMQKEAGITPDDLRKMSHTQDPRYRFIRKGAKLLGKARTPTHTFMLGGKSVNMTDGNLIDFYLSAQQEGGVDHIKQSVKIFGRKITGVTDADIKQITQYVESNQKVKAQCDIMTKIATEKNNPQLNDAFHGMGGDKEEEIADNENYWHLTTDTPETAKGKMAVSMSFIDNPRVLKERTGGKVGLVISDAFDKFSNVEEAVAAYIGLGHPIQNMRTLLNYQPFIDTLDSKGLAQVRHKLIVLMDRAQNPRNTESTAAKVVQPFISGVYRGVLQFNPRPIVAEFMGEIQELALPDFDIKKDITKLGAGLRNPAMVKEMWEHSPTAYMRFHYGTSSFELAELERNEHALTMFTGQHSDINKPSVMMKSTDALKLVLGWQKAKEVIAEQQPDLKPDSKEYWDAVDKKAGDYWQQTCPSWDRWNRSMNSSDPTIGRQLFFMFRSYWEKANSVLNTATLDYQYSDKGTEAKKKLAQSYGATLASIMANAAIRAMIGQYVWQQKRTLAQNVADIVTGPFQLMAVAGPYLQRATSSFIQLTTGQKLAPSFASNQSLPLEMMSMAGASIDDYAKAAGHWINGDKEKAKKELEKGVMSSAMIAALTRGVPVYDIQRTYRAWIAQQETRTRRNYNVATRGH